MYYIISLKHTHKREKFITLWRPNDCGYTWFKSMAGTYGDYKRGYHDGDSAMPVKAEDVEKLFVEVEYEGRKQMVIPNNKKSWKALNLKFTKEGMRKIEVTA